MERYLGMDVHKTSCSFCVLDASGRRVRQDVVETNGQALVGYLKQQPGRLHLCFEESEWALWLWEILSPFVAELVVTQGEKRQGVKSDMVDAQVLAERLRTGQAGPSIFKAPNRCAKLRELGAVYEALTRDVVRTKNRLRSRFRRRGVECTGPEVYRPERRQKRLRSLPPAMTSTQRVTSFREATRCTGLIVAEHPDFSGLRPIGRNIHGFFAEIRATACE